MQLYHTHTYAFMHAYVAEGVGTDADAVREMQLWIYN